MAPRRFRLKSPTPSSLASIPYPGLRPLTTLPFALRSTSPNKPLPLSPAMIGGLAAIGTLALLSAVGVGLALHARYCRRSDCSVCSTIVCFTRLRGSHTIRSSCSQGFAKLLTGLLITDLFQLMITVPRVHKRSRTPTLKLPVPWYTYSNPPSRIVGSCIRHPFPLSHYLQSFIPTDHNTRRWQHQALWFLHGGP